MNRKTPSLATDPALVAPLSSKDFSPPPLTRSRGAQRVLPQSHGDDGAGGATAAPEDLAWRESMRTAIRSAAELRRVLQLPTPGAEHAAGAVQAAGAGQASPAADYDFPVFVPREFAARMRRGDPADPLLRQVLPTDEEGAVVPGYSTDPVGDLSANVVPGVLHKYHGRALMITTGACGVHCRYCFRRSFPYSDAGSRSEAYAPSIAYLDHHTDVEEVILSGGDPLTMTDVAIEKLLDQIEAISHVTRLRIHSRMPIVIPSRVTSRLVARLQQSRLAVWMVVHCNHAAEIDEATASALGRLIDAGVPVLNQSVLLRGVNDDAESLELLSRALMQCRVIPYYLHQLDRVAGAAHFEVAAQRGRELIGQLEARLPGFGVPRYVAEIAGERSKTRL